MTLPLMFKAMQQQHLHSTTFQHSPSFVGTVHETTVMIWNEARAHSACPRERNQECRVESALKSELEIPYVIIGRDAGIYRSDNVNSFEETDG